MKPGHHKRLLGELRRQHEALQLEQDLRDQELTEAFRLQKAAAAGYDILFVDLQEGFAGKANPSKLASRYGLVAGAPMELSTGWDLRTRSGQQKWRRMVLQDKPFLIIIGFPVPIGVCSIGT